jgi:hypothetical protein
MNYHAHIAEIARQREYELRRLQPRHERHAQSGRAAANDAPRSSTIASLLRNARATLA